MPPNQPPLNFPPPSKRVDFLGPLLKAAQLKFQQQQIESTNLFRKQQLGFQQQGIEIQKKRLGIAQTKAERPNIGPIDPAKYVLSTVEEFENTGDFGVLEFTEEAKKTQKSITPLDLQAYISSKGRTKGPSIPNNLTLPDAIKTRDDRLAGRVKVARETGAARVELQLKGEITKQRSATVQLDNVLTQIEDSLEANQAIPGTPGTIARTFVGIADQVKAVVNLLVPGAHLETINKISLYTEALRETAGASAQFKSAIVNAAILMAKAEGFEDRAITKFRVETNINRLIGSTVGSASLLFGVIEQVRKQNIDKFQAAFEAQQQTGPIDFTPRTFTPLEGPTSEIEQPSTQQPQAGGEQQFPRRVLPDGRIEIDVLGKKVIIGPPR